MIRINSVKNIKIFIGAFLNIPLSSLKSSKIAVIYITYTANSLCASMRFHTGEDRLSCANFASALPLKYATRDINRSSDIKKKLTIPTVFLFVNRFIISKISIKIGRATTIWIIHGCIRCGISIPIGI